MSLPPCGVYRTTVQIGAIEPGRLVYFHNHGDPGPGIYPPESWRANRAVFSKRGTTLEDEGMAASLESLASEGLYRVREQLYCCEKRCRSFEAGLLVQLGYNAAAQPLLFVPHWDSAGLHLPSKGYRLDEMNTDKLELLKVDPPPVRAVPEEQLQ